jgi:lipopolysaccharide biosynthesis protein
METKNNKLIVVLGMHRSGTSAVTRGLRTMGVSLGERMMPPIEGNNAKGFWEDIDLNALNIEMLGAINSDWHRLAPIEPIDVEILHKQGFLLRAVELLRKKVGNVPVFGFKDPRVAKLLPFWKVVFGDQLDVSYVLAVRHPLSVSRSLAKRDGIEAEQSYLLWLDHVLTSLTGSAGNKRLIVDYDRLMQTPDRELMRVAKCAGLEIDPTELQNYKSGFLDQGLRHTVYEPNDLLLDYTCPPIVREVYTALLDVASDKIQLDDPSLQRKVECWVSEFNRLKSTLVLVDRLSTQMAVANRVMAERDGQVVSLNQAVAERDGQVASLNRAVAERDGRIASLNQAVAERDGRIAGLNQAAAERDGQIASLNGLIEEIVGSKSWRVTAPLRTVASAIRKVRSVFAVLPLILQKSGGLYSTLRKLVLVVRNEGMVGVRIRLRRFFANHVFIPGIGAASESKLSIVPYYIDPKLDSIAVACGTKDSIAVHLHLYHTEMIEEFVSYLNNIPVQYDLYVSVPESCDEEAIRTELNTLLSRVRNVVVEPVPNRGRDIAPMIVQFGTRLSQYGIIAHIHTKKSPHKSNLADWRQDILTRMMGPPESSGGRVAHIIGLLQTTAKIVFPEGRTEFIKDRSGWADNYDLARHVLEKYTKISIHEFPCVEFPEGSMFWARAECLKDFLGLPFKYDDFLREPIAADGTLAHALERLILIFASEKEGQCIRLHEGDSIKDYRHYEIQHDYSMSLIHEDVQVLTYYLPQFHPIPENDLWHGEGFTEWTKVRAANPLFEGHYQQHIPHPDIGYYLLDSPDTLRRQAEMMQKSGVHGQVFYHYWFSGKLILEEPAQLLLNTPDIRMRFCFCWANENWTRRWDGNENEILLSQNYSAQDAHDFIHYLIPFFKDSRYIKVEDRPVLFVYRPSSIPDSQEYLDVWKRECEKAGIKQPYVVAVLTRGATNPKDFGMDAGVERVLHDWTAGAVPEIKKSLRCYQPINGSVLSYDDVANFYMGQTEAKDFTYFRSLVPIWDNTARYGSETYMLHGSTPQSFQEWMESTIAYTQSTLPSDRRFVLINAWNEWAEGAHLEPDSRYGYGYLNSVGRALSGIPYSGELNPSCAIPVGTKVHLSFPRIVLEQLQSDPDLKRRFLHCLSRSSVFNICSVSINVPDLMQNLPIAVQADPGNADFILGFRKIAFFDSSVIEKMLHTACASGSAVIANSYDGDSPLIEVTANGSVHSSVPYAAPLLLVPKIATEFGYKNFRLRTDARCFVTYPSLRADTDKPVITTIIRYHKSADLNELKNALYCLYAMRGCVVIPLVAAQDLSKPQIEALEKTLNDFAWAKGCEPQVHFYQSPDGKGDLRSKMLNESLKKVKTRYAAFLDFDDLLMSHAYSWLVGRLESTGKAVSFGRVYSTSYDSATGLLVERNRVYEYCYSYEEFIRLNHAPLHSFMLDMEQLDLSRIVYFEDQRYMEDYLLTLQLFTKFNSDWAGLKEDRYIGDYIHSVDRAHTLAFSDDQERLALLSSPEYKVCEQRICDMRNSVKTKIDS